jgi:hypothetical protein
MSRFWLLDLCELWAHLVYTRRYSNNNNKLKMRRHPVAVVILHITYTRTLKFDYSRFRWGGLHGTHVVATWKVKTGTIPAFALGPRKTKKNLCRDGRSQDLPATDLQPAVRHLSECLSLVRMSSAFYMQVKYNCVCEATWCTKTTEEFV